MEFFSFLISPIVVVMGWVLELLVHVTSNYGLSIMLLSVIVSVLVTPILWFSKSVERRDRAIQVEMAPLIEAAKQQGTSRERFEAVDAVYQQFGYHPIRSVVSILPLFLQLPFLIAALWLLTGLGALDGVSFLFLRDLSKPDALLSLGGSMTINILPLSIAAVTLTESFGDQTADRATKMRFFVVTLVILVLVYPMPSAVCLYWLSSTAVSLLRAKISGARGARGASPA